MALSQLDKMRMAGMQDVTVGGVSAAFDGCLVVTLVAACGGTLRFRMPDADAAKLQAWISDHLSTRSTGVQSVMSSGTRPSADPNDGQAPSPLARL